MSTKFASSFVVPVNAIVEFQDARFQIEHEMILNAVNLKIEAGAFVYFLGSTGSGKSTLLKSMYGAVSLAGGFGRVCGMDLVGLKASQLPYLRRQVGIVFQDFKLWYNQSCGANIDFVLRATTSFEKIERQKRIQEVLERVGLWNKRDEKPSRLSGGEQQCLCVARAIVNQPKLIIADEATGNLDPVSSEAILKLLRELNESGTTVVFATHDMMLYNKFPARTYEFSNGTCHEI
ncbi:MAG: putative cell division ATP-binding protein FtsE [Bacteroidota bacterium]|jgi:cell division transport system ATP-binding protein|nr:ATP-binding cassette domain-containing protein [Sphingobacteriia bacterium]